MSVGQHGAQWLVEGSSAVSQQEGPGLETQGFLFVEFPSEVNL